MAVYTEVSDAELSAFVARYDIGRLLSAKGIAEGVELELPSADGERVFHSDAL